MMLMFFKFFTVFDHFMFDDWTAASIGAFVGVCLFSAALAILAEFLAFVKVYLSKKANVNPLVYGLAEGDSGSHPAIIRPLLIPPSISDYRNRRLCFHVAQTLVHVLHLVSGYFVMLAVMTYNAWVAIAVLLGALVGYFIFGAFRDVCMLNQVEIPSSQRDSQEMLVSDFPEDPDREELIQEVQPALHI